MDPLNLQTDLKKFPWPDGTTRVFSPGEPIRRVAWIPQDSEQWHRYGCGYKEAAKRVYESWCALSDDCLVYPLIFLHRHYVELRLKELLQSGSHFLNLPINWQCNHNIVSLWNLFKEIFPRIWPEEGGRDINNAERLVMELAAGDPDSLHFRYPKTKKGQKHLENRERIDLVLFVDAMKRLESFLDGANDTLSIYKENNH